MVIRYIKFVNRGKEAEVEVVDEEEVVDVVEVAVVVVEEIITEIIKAMTNNKAHLTMHKVHTKVKVNNKLKKTNPTIINNHKVKISNNKHLIITIINRTQVHPINNKQHSQINNRRLHKCNNNKHSKDVNIIIITTKMKLLINISNLNIVEIATTTGIIIIIETKTVEEVGDGDVILEADGAEEITIVIIDVDEEIKEMNPQKPMMRNILPYKLIKSSKKNSENELIF
eukprot:UN33265